MAGTAILALATGFLVARADESGSIAPSSETISLAAERVRFWDDGPHRWVVLEGRAAVFQGPDGLRAASALVRIDADETTGPKTYHIEARSLEPDPHREKGTPPQWITLETRGEVRLQSYEPKNLTRLDRAPAEFAEAIAAMGPVPAAHPRPVSIAPPDFDPAVERTQAEVGTSPASTAPAPDPTADLQPPPPSLTEPQPPPTVIQPGPGNTAASAPSRPATSAVPTRIEGPTVINLDDLAPPSEISEPAPGAAPGRTVTPVLPETRRFIVINPRDSSQKFAYDGQRLPDGQVRIIIRGGLNIVVEEPGKGTLDISADSAVVWTKTADDKAPSAGQRFGQDKETPLEVYLEGHVIFRQDERKLAGANDQRTLQAERLYIDLRTLWFYAHKAELDIFNPNLVAPLKVYGETIRQYRKPLGRQGDKMIYGPSEIEVTHSLMTGSRFPEPGYRFQSRIIDLTELERPKTGPDGKPVANPNDPNGPQDVAWNIDARSNIFKIGPVPVFYWPRIVTDSDDITPPLQQMQYRYNNYFGSQIITGWNLFKVFGIKRPTFIDQLNLDVDYLSMRGPAAGLETGWSGRDLVGDLTDPYHHLKNSRSVNLPYFGYFDVWGIYDQHPLDVLGPGPAVVTYGPPGAGKAGYQRTGVPAFQDDRGRLLLRHMQYLTDPDAPDNEEMRLQLEVAYISDRHFLEQYFKRIFDVGLDQATLAYFNDQRENHAFTFLSSGNFQDWYTYTQWFPKLDYYRLGDSFFNLFTYYQNTGIGYANVHTDAMVNDPNLFAFVPYDPVSATSGVLQTGRAWTSHELDLPLNLEFVRLTPYVQGQLVGWNSQYATAMPPLTLSTVLPDTAYIRDAQRAALGRYWGAAGARFNVMAWRAFPTVENELLNVHGLTHKINFDIDARFAYSNVPLNRIGVMDELDDNTYEFVRRYFALINYVGGVLPAQFDPRFLMLRSAISPITGTTDIQSSIDTVQFAIRQRLQTKRGPEGKRRVIDWMSLDLTATYFPDAQRDNFGKPWGLMKYNYEWFLGDRTSFVSTGWFEYWNVTGTPILLSNPTRANSPFGLDILTWGFSFARPPRSNIYLGYSIINSGVINTSALNMSFSYWVSPKWYGSFGTSYDFGNQRWLGSTLAFTRIGADWLTSIGVSADPLRSTYNVGVELTPRLSPTMRFGSGGGAASFDPRFAPTQ